MDYSWAWEEYLRLGAEVERLTSRIHDLEAEIMRTGGELVIEVGRRLAAERKLAETEADASATTATRASLVCVRQGVAHLFEDGDDGRKFLVDSGDDWSFAAWTVSITWHPASRPDPRGNVATDRHPGPG